MASKIPGKTMGTNKITGNKNKLNLQQQKFCVEYLIDFNATQAYLRAGYKCKVESASTSAFDFLRNPKIIRFIDNMLSAEGLSKHFVLKRLFDIANSSIACLFNEDGTIKNPTEISPDDLRTIASIKIQKRQEHSGPDSKPTGQIKVIEIKFWSKDKALENLGRYFKLFTDKVENKSNIDAKLAEILAKGDEVAERYHEKIRKEKEKIEKSNPTPNSNV